MILQEQPTSYRQLLSNRVIELRRRLEELQDKIYHTHGQIERAHLSAEKDSIYLEELTIDKYRHLFETLVIQPLEQKMREADSRFDVAAYEAFKEAKEICGSMQKDLTPLQDICEGCGTQRTRGNSALLYGGDRICLVCSYRQKPNNI